MLNKEKYKEEIWNIACKGKPISLVNGEPSDCFQTMCEDCDLFISASTCTDGFAEWANSEYKEPEIDWSKVPVDTPILVSNNGEHWHKRHFARFKYDRVYVWANGFTSWSSYGNSNASEWKYVKLANEEDAEKYRKE